MAESIKSRFKPSFPKKYNGNAKNIICRSSWERRFCNYCDINESIIEWGSEEFFIPYVSPKDKAMALLKSKLMVIAVEQRAAEIADIRGDIVEAAWGNQIRNYVFHPYQMVKDLRTEQETADIDSVMNGQIVIV